MESVELEGLALRAIELRIQQRRDARLVVVAKARAKGPGKLARIVGALANAANDRTALLLLGMRASAVIGVDPAIDLDALIDRVLDRLPGARPEVQGAIVRVDDAFVAAVLVRPADQLVPVRRGDRIEVLTVVDGAVVPLTNAGQPTAAKANEALPEFRVREAWVERIEIEPHTADDRQRIVAYQGTIDVALGPTAGRILDRECSVTLLFPGTEAPLALAAQVHPNGSDVGVDRIDDGLDIRSTFGAALLLAGAVPALSAPGHAAGGVAQLVVSILLPGRAVPELRTLMLAYDPDQGRWVGGTVARPD